MIVRIAALLGSAALAAACATGGAVRAPGVFTHGVASGDMRGDSAVLWTRTREAMRVVPQLSRTPDFEQAVDLPAIDARAESDFTAKAVASGLAPGARYYYRFRADEATSAVGTFRTPYAPGDHAAVRMAFSGDADWKWKPYPAVASLVEENLDFFLFLGDVIYETMDLKGETVAEDLAGYRFKYRENREPRANSRTGMVPLRDLYAAFGQYSVFDNHEIGLSARKPAPAYTEGGARAAGEFVNRTPGFRDRIRAYGEYQPVRLDPVAGTGDPRMDGTYRFYGAIPWGANVELIVLDDRSYRDARIPKVESPAAGSCERTMLGAAQREWFEQALLAAQRRGAIWKVVVISSPIQELGTASQVGLDLDSFKGWAGNYRCERSRVLKFIDDHEIDNVVFVTTDYHMTVINNLFYDSEPGNARSPRKAARNAFEILTGPLGAITGSPFRNRFPVANLGSREADARILSVLNGDLRKAGMDPVGLEPGFPGLDIASIRIHGKPSAADDALAFATFATYSYAVLTFDPASVHVQLKALPYVADPATLLDPAHEAEYEARRATEVSSFVVHARPAPR